MTVIVSQFADQEPVESVESEIVEAELLPDTGEFENPIQEPAVLPQEETRLVSEL